MIYWILASGEKVMVRDMPTDAILNEVRQLQDETEPKGMSLSMKKATAKALLRFKRELRRRDLLRGRQNRRRKY